jgi:hypothetical protein
MLRELPSGELLYRSYRSCFGFCLAFDHLFKIFVRFFYFSFFPELVTMCVVNALTKGDIDYQSVQGGWMVAPWCDE